MHRKFRSLKAVSPVIATIILVSIAIVMSIAVAYWLLGLGGSLMGTEKLQFQTGYVTQNATAYTINVGLKNIGSKDATIDLVFVNQVPQNAVNWIPTNGSVVVGKTISGTIDLLKTQYASGISIDVNIKTVAGYEYPKSIVLP